jgi:hypothetical protein
VATTLRAFIWLACLASISVTGTEPVVRLVAKTETVYADAIDAMAAVETIDSGLTSRYGGRDRRAWQRLYGRKRGEFLALLAKLPKQGLAESDARAIAVMRTRIENAPANLDRAPHSLKPVGRCNKAGRKDLDFGALRDALYACFDEIGNRLEFEGGRLTRVSALARLASIEEPARRKNLFLAFAPLWQAVNGNNQPGSPYRRLMGLAAADDKKNGSPIDTAARAAGARSTEIESWLEQILEAWRQVSGEHAIEPWDFRYLAEEADRDLAASIPRDSLQRIAGRYYRDLGADLHDLGILYDLDPRPGKAPLAYSELVRLGRMVHGRWRPTVARVSANYAHGGLSLLNELIHEDGHAVHYAALRTRPAFMDLDTLFAEAFADVAAWNTYEPAWQRQYLGREASKPASLRSLYSGVVLDVAWSLFEIRMMRNPALDPNKLWTEITSRYLRVVPHPEWSWWATRVQLVESPGYMVHYGLGAVLTAAMRQRIRESLGPFETGNLRWYAWVSNQLLRYGTERDAAALLQEFLGRPVSPELLLKDIRGLSQATS